MTEHKNERELVLDILLAVTRDGEYSHIAVKNVLEKYQYLEKNSRAFTFTIAMKIQRFRIKCLQTWKKC